MNHPLVLISGLWLVSASVFGTVIVLLSWLHDCGSWCYGDSVWSESEYSEKIDMAIQLANFSVPQEPRNFISEFERIEMDRSSSGE